MNDIKFVKVLNGWVKLQDIKEFACVLERNSDTRNYDIIAFLKPSGDTKRFVERHFETMERANIRLNEIISQIQKG